MKGLGPLEEPVLGGKVEMEAREDVRLDHGYADISGDLGGRFETASIAEARTACPGAEKAKVFVVGDVCENIPPPLLRIL